MNKKLVLITGASAGLGLACANRLHDSGWTVIGASRRVTSSGAWRGLSMNVDDDDSVNNGVAEIIAQHGRIDAVITGAGWGLAGPAEQTPITDARAQMETNFWGTVRVVNATLPIMRHQGGGRLVAVSSLCGVIAIPFQSFYSASKFALEGYVEALAYEVAPFSVHVTLVEPGNFKTDFTANRRTVSSPADDPYAAATSKAISTMERDESNGADPALVAKAVERVLGLKRPPRHISVGKSGERVGLIAKRLLPYRVFERAARSSLGI
jgi:NAD(P)-dependent dehydrogenase (short-subunit alcohol dehydrogenase family)